MPYHLSRIDASRFRLLPNHSKGGQSSTEKHTQIVVTKPQKSPFDLLPIELHAEIFAEALLPFPQGPLLLSRVCTAWKRIVFSTPKLWSSFDIQLEGSGTTIGDARIMRTMELWLKRSKNYPLSTRIIHTPKEITPNRRAAQFLALLIPEAHRWKHVQFIMPVASIVPLQEQLPSRFPALQSLALQMKGTWDSCRNINILEMNIPWHQLTELNLQLGLSDRLKLDDCLDILSKTTAVIRCTMSVECVLDPESVDRKVVSLPALTNLQLMLRGYTETDVIDMKPKGAPQCLTQFLHLLSVPKLESLELRWLLPWMETWSEVHDEFLKFLRGSARTLTALTLAYLPTDESQLLECLETVPGLTDLDLRFSLNDEEHDPITDRFLSSLTHPLSVQTEHLQSRYPDKDAFLLPFLRSIHLQCQGDSYTSATLIALVQSRWRAPQSSGKFAHGRLRKFHLSFMNSAFEELEKRVKQWVSEGLNASITSMTVL